MSGRRFALSGIVLLVLACGGEEPREKADELRAPMSFEERALALHREAIVIDAHSDTTPRFEDPGWDFLERHDRVDGDMDLPRMRDGGLDVQFWSIYMGRREGEGLAIREALERIDAVHRLVSAHPGDLALATSAREIREHVAAGRVVSLMGLEGGHIIEENLAALRNFHRLGVRYMTLTHSFHTPWADSSGTREDIEPLHGGLTDFGREIVREMNRLGMMVDLSHVSDDTFWDVLEVSEAPVLVSHSSVRGVAKHRRNVSDAMLKALAENGGVIMINFYPAYIDEQVAKQTAGYFKRWEETLASIRQSHVDDPAGRRRAYAEHFSEYPLPVTSLEVLLDHFDHAIAVAGPNHVGLGADWDGVPSMPVGMQDVSELPNLTRGLLARGHSEDTVRKVLGENLLRLLEQVEEVGAELRAGARGR